AIPCVRVLLVALLALGACAPAPAGTRPPLPANSGGSPSSAAPGQPANVGAVPSTVTGSPLDAGGPGGAIPVAALSPPLAVKVGSRELIGEAGIFAAIEKGY